MRALIAAARLLLCAVLFAQIVQSTTVLREVSAVESAHDEGLRATEAAAAAADAAAAAAAAPCDPYASAACEVPPLGVDGSDWRAELSAERADIEDVTDILLPLFNDFADWHSALRLQPAPKERRSAMNWCEVQRAAGCDLVYPVEVALAAARVPGYYPASYVPSLWYSAGMRAWNFQKSVRENAEALKKEKHWPFFVDMVASGPVNRTLGCCRANCLDGNSAIFGCSFGPAAPVAWGYAGAAPNRRLILQVEPSIENDVMTRAPEATLAAAALRHASFAELDDLVDLGCPGNVPGAGPRTVADPWVFPCEGTGPAPPPPGPAAPLRPLVQLEKQLQARVQLECNSTATSLPPDVRLPALFACPDDCSRSLEEEFDFLFESHHARKPNARLAGKVGALAADAENPPLCFSGKRPWFSADVRAVLPAKGLATAYAQLGCAAMHAPLGVHAEALLGSDLWEVFGGVANSGRATFVLRNSQCEAAELLLRFVRPPGRPVRLFGDYLSSRAPLVALDWRAAKGTVALQRCAALADCESGTAAFTGHGSEAVAWREVALRKLPAAGAAHRWAARFNGEDVLPSGQLPGLPGEGSFAFEIALADLPSLLFVTFDVPSKDEGAAEPPPANETENELNIPFPKYLVSSFVPHWGIF